MLVSFQILLVNVIVDSFLGLLPIAFVISDKNISKIVCLVYKENCLFSLSSFDIRIIAQKSIIFFCFALF